MIDIVLDEKEHNYGISQGFGIAMITVACISFLLSLWPMIETKLHGRKKNYLSNKSQRCWNRSGKWTLLRYSLGDSIQLWKRRIHLCRLKRHSDHTICSLNSWWTCLIMKSRTRATDYWTTKSSTSSSWMTLTSCTIWAPLHSFKIRLLTII